MTTTYATGNPLGSTAVRDLSDNASNLDDAVNGKNSVWVDRFGRARQSLFGMAAEFDSFISNSGFVWLGDYEEGLTFSRRNQYTVREGLAYRPADSALLPFVTTGNWIDEQAKFVAFDTSIIFSQDLANSTDFNKGVKLVGGSIRVLNKFEDLRTLPSSTGSVFVLGYSAPGDGGGGLYTFSSTDTTSADNGGTIAVSAVDDGRWKIKTSNGYDVRMFGAKGNGVNDDTAAIQSCINALSAVGGGVLRLGNGNWMLSDDLKVTGGNITIKGTSKFGSLLHQKSLTKNILTVTGSYFQLEDVSFLYNGTPGAGAVALWLVSNFARCSNFVIRSAEIGIVTTQCSALTFTGFAILDYEQAGILTTKMSDICISQFVMNAGNHTRGRLGGIRLLDQVEAFFATDGDILLGVYSITCAASSNSAANRPAYNKFTNVYCDSSLLGSSITRTVETDFTACWFSCGRGASPASGCTVTESQNVRYSGGQFFNNGATGCIVGGDSIGISFIGVSFESNSVSSGPGVSHGLEILAGNIGTRVIGCNAGNGLYPGGQQAFGIFVGSGCVGLHISGGYMERNINGAIGGDIAGSLGQVMGVTGFNTLSKGVASIPIGQTAIVLVHGLASTPSVQDINLNWADSIAGKGASAAWVTNITANTFQIAVNAPVTSSAINIAWRAGIKGN